MFLPRITSLLVCCVRSLYSHGFPCQSEVVQDLRSVELNGQFPLISPDVRAQQSLPPHLIIDPKLGIILERHSLLDSKGIIKFLG